MKRGTPMSNSESRKRHTAEIDVAVREEWRVTYEGNDYEDTFLTEPEALAWAARWKAPVIDHRTVKVTTETSSWTRVIPPEVGAS